MVFVSPLGASCCLCVWQSALAARKTERGILAQISDIAGLRAAGLDTRLVAQRATEAYLMQVLKHGFLHSGKPRLPRAAMMCMQHRLATFAITASQRLNAPMHCALHCRSSPRQHRCVG